MLSELANTVLNATCCTIYIPDLIFMQHVA